MVKNWLSGVIFTGSCLQHLRINYNILVTCHLRCNVYQVRLICVRDRINKGQVKMARLTWLNIIASVSISFLIPQCRALAMQDGVPHFNIERTCREARTYAAADKEVAYKGCLKDETDAREQMPQNGRVLRRQTAATCVMQGAAPMPSYVELLTCLEMSAEVEALDAPVGVRANKTRGSPRQTSSEPAPGPPPGDTPAPPLENGTLPKPK